MQDWHFKSCVCQNLVSFESIIKIYWQKNYFAGAKHAKSKFSDFSFLSLKSCLSVAQATIKGDYETS